MNYSNYRFTLDMQSNISQVSLPVRLLDTSRKLYISLTDGGSPYTIADGCRAVFYARKADGKTIMNDCIIEKNTTIRYDLTQQTTTCAGIVDCEVRLYGADGNLITSPRFILVVDERVVYDDDFPLSESEQSALDNIAISETARVYAEELRVAAEKARVSAETARASAETERATATSEALFKINNFLKKVEPTIVEVSLLASAWVGEAHLYSQIINVEGVTKYSKVDLQPSVEQLAIFHDKDLALVTENEDGVVTVYAIGDKPTNDYTIQATVTEVTE